VSPRPLTPATGLIATGLNVKATTVAGMARSTTLGYSHYDHLSGNSHAVVELPHNGGFRNLKMLLSLDWNRYWCLRCTLDT
jgi:hypothetical protein